MDFNKVLKILGKEITSIDFEVTEQTKDKLKMKATVTASKYFDDSILLQILVFNSGTVHVNFVFDAINRTLSNYELINDFNDNSPFLHGYISAKEGGDYFEVHGYDYSSSNEKEVVEAISFFLGQLLKDYNLKYLQPISRVTLG